MVQGLVRLGERIAGRHDPVPSGHPPPSGAASRSAMIYLLEAYCIMFVFCRRPIRVGSEAGPTAGSSAGVFFGPTRDNGGVEKVIRIHSLSQMPFLLAAVSMDQLVLTLLCLGQLRDSGKAVALRP